MHDDLGDRMKTSYENRTRYLLPRRGYTIIRIDGKCFHSYTKGLKQPFDDGLIEDIDNTAKYLCKNIMGAQFAFVQSDEISILLTDFEFIGTDAWFDNNIQKMVSVSASMATSRFNRARYERYQTVFFHGLPNKDAEFDSRVFQIPSHIEVENYFIWRQQDTVRNSISAVAQSLYSHKQLDGKNMSEQQEMIFQKGQNWNDYDDTKKRGRIVLKETYLKDEATRTLWIAKAPPTFTENREFLKNLIPIME